MKVTSGSSTGTTTVQDKTVTTDAADPCATEEPDTEAPTPPARVTADATNTSPASAEATATTGDTAPAPAAGTPLGTDPRKDPIYFVLTARFHDGDSSNNRGGSQHTKSGNAANNDPMFRGDFKGLVEKLDYIKALGFSAVWITPSSSTARTTTTTATTAMT